MKSKRLLARAGVLLAMTLIYANVHANPASSSTTDDSAAAAVLEGTITLRDGEPARDVRVLIVELRRSVFTDENGRYRFDNVPPGSYHLQAVSPGRGGAVEEIDILPGDNTLDMEMTISAHKETIVVTATRHGRGSAEVVQPVSVLEENQLNEKMAPTIGETLNKEAGVNSTYYGPGSSRPVIRGQSGGRIRVLESGVGVGDASTISPDHAVATDPMNAERVEIVRGPAALLYDPQAVGGVVNIIDSRIPEYAPPRPFQGRLNLRLGSVSDERTGGVDLNGKLGKFAWHVDAMRRETDDYSIPGNAVVDDPTSASGTLPNSSLETESGTLGGSWVGETGFAGASVRAFSSNYGIPMVEADEETIRIDMEQLRYDVRGGFDTAFGPFSGVHFNAAFTDYEHREIEGDEVATTFLNDFGEARVELPQLATGSLTGVVGLQLSDRDLEAIGEEAFLPASRTRRVALFALEEVESGPMRYEIGVRAESQDNEADGSANRSFALFSGSFGLLWSPAKRYALGFSIARTERGPAAEELYSDGPHLATFIFQRGDPTLGEEVGATLDLSLRRRTGRITGELNLFYNDYQDYIFLDPTGEVEDGLPVFEYAQSDAAFYGAELSAILHLLHHDGGRDLDLRFLVDGVRAELTDGEPLPFIPAARFGVGLSYQGTRWYASADVTVTAEQDRVPEFLTPTDGFTLLAATVGYRFSTRGMVHDIMLRGSNLTDAEARNAASILKDRVPLPGRDVSLVYRFLF